MAQKIINLEDLKYYDGKRRTQITEEITNATKGKVDKVEGKGLSTNDLTDELLEKNPEFQQLHPPYPHSS